MHAGSTKKPENKQNRAVKQTAPTFMVSAQTTLLFGQLDSLSG
jgi:hypothetical protein